MRFAIRELSRSPSTGIYTLRRTGLKTRIRHPLIDSWVVEEIFGHGAYEPPTRVSRLLKSRGADPRIVDLGGHAGLFGLFALGRFPEAHIVSFEPDPGNVEALRECVRLNAAEARWTIIPAAAGTADGSLEFVSNHHFSHAADAPSAVDGAVLQHVFPFMAGRALMSGRSVEVPVNDCFPELFAADLIKIDIEGGEWPILGDPRFEQLDADAIVVECHRPSSPVPDPAAYVRERLSAAGYDTSITQSKAGEAFIAWGAKSARRAGSLQK